MSIVNVKVNVKYDTNHFGTIFDNTTTTNNS